MASPLLVVTGSAGLIGSRLADAFADRYRIVGLDVKPPRKATAQWIECDFTRDDSVSRAFQQISTAHGQRIASVIHLAAHYDFSGSPSPLYQELTVNGTRRLLRSLRSLAVEQIVFSSTLLVMKPAEREDQVLTEDSPTEAAWDYPASKLAAEQAIREERGSIPSVVLRIAGVYDEECHSIPIAQQIRRIYEKSFESYFFPGDASRGQPFVHLDDLVDCFLATVERRSRLGPEQVLLIAEPDLMSYAELQDQLGELIHAKEWPTIRVPAPIAKVGAWVKEKVAREDESFIKPWMIDLADAHYPMSIARARSLLGWDPVHKLRDTLSHMVGRLKQDPRRFYEINGLPFPDRSPEEEEQASLHPSGVSEKR